MLQAMPPLQLLQLSLLLPDVSVGTVDPIITPSTGVFEYVRIW